MTEGNQPGDRQKPSKKPKPPAEPIDYDWRDPSKPRNPEDDAIVDSWQRLADGTFEKVEEDKQNLNDETENSL